MNECVQRSRSLPPWRRNHPLTVKHSKRITHSLAVKSRKDADNSLLSAQRAAFPIATIPYCTVVTLGPSHSDSALEVTLVDGTTVLYTYFSLVQRGALSPGSSSWPLLTETSAEISAACNYTQAITIFSTTSHSMGSVATNIDH